jgi:hypothetical protein
MADDGGGGGADESAYVTPFVSPQAASTPRIAPSDSSSITATGTRRPRSVRRVGVGSPESNIVRALDESIASRFRGGSLEDSPSYQSFDEAGASRLSAAGFEPDRSAVFGASERVPRARLLNIMSEQTTYLHEQCLFPSSFIKLLESGKSLSRATIPYKFLDILKKLDAEDSFAIQCAYLSYENNATTRSPQAVVEEFISNQDDVATLGHGVNLAIRQFVNWHQQCLSWTHEHDDHRRKVVFPHLIRALTIPILDLSKEDLPDLAFPMIANEFYSYHLSLKLARGHEEAFSRKLQAKSVDSVKATIVFSYVQYAFWTFLSLPDVRAGQIETLTATDLLQNARTLSSLDWEEYSKKHRGDIDRLTGLSKELKTEIKNIRTVGDYRESKSLKTSRFGRGKDSGFKKTAEAKMKTLVAADPSFKTVKTEIDAEAPTKRKPSPRKDAFSDVTVVAEQPRTEEDEAEDEALAFADP